jgi:steroid delta-isomerase-like uncharacterized protein
MTDQRSIVTRYYRDLWNRFDKALIPELLEESIRFRGSLGDQTVGHASFAAYMDRVRTAFPDFKNSIETIVSEGDQSFARLSYEGTHLGSLLGIPATGRRVRYAGASLFRFHAGRIAELWVLGDLHGLLEQIRHAAGAHPIEWRLHLRSSPETVFDLLATEEGRARFWAEGASEREGRIHFRFPDGTRFAGRVLGSERPHAFDHEYFEGTTVRWRLAADGAGGTDLTLSEQVGEAARGGDAVDLTENRSGWVSVLMSLKAAADFGVDLRNHDPQRSWGQLYVDN